MRSKTALTSLIGRLIKIGAMAMRDDRDIAIQMAEGAVARKIFADIPQPIFHI